MKYYCKAYNLYKTGEDKQDCISKIDNLSKNYKKMDLIQQLLLSEEEIEILKDETNKLKTEIDDLKSEITNYRVII